MKDINRRDFLMRSLLASGGILMGSLIDQEGLLGNILVMAGAGAACALILLKRRRDAMKRS